MDISIQNKAEIILSNNAQIERLSDELEECNLIVSNCQPQLQDLQEDSLSCWS